MVHTLLQVTRNGSNVFKLDKMVVPVNVGGNHWCLCVAYVTQGRVQCVTPSPPLRLSFYLLCDVQPGTLARPHALSPHPIAFALALLLFACLGTLTPWEAMGCATWTG